MSKNSQAGRRSLAVVAAATVLALAAGGGAVAGSLITSKDIQDKTITSADLHKNSVKTQKVKDGTLKIQDLNKKAQDALKKAGPQGPKGPAGPPGRRVRRARRAPRRASPLRAPATRPCGRPTVRSTRPSRPAPQVNTSRAVASPPSAVRACLRPRTSGATTPTSRSRSARRTSLPDSAYVPISDTNSRFYADRWVVRGYNNGPTGQVVRAWALCAPLPASLILGASSPVDHPVGGGFVSPLPRSCQFPGATISHINILNGCRAGQNLTSVGGEVQIGQHFEFGKSP